VLWALGKGLVSGVFVSLLMPWIIMQLTLAHSPTPPPRTA
jgi:hypothetical protein